MFSHFNRWIDFLQDKLLRRKLQLDDYVFPHISSNGLVHIYKQINHDAVQKLITEFAVGAGLNGRYTTHCFRRGGAQYRFMKAPIGQRWSLTIVRWWGGWAEGEQVSYLSMRISIATPAHTAPCRLTPFSVICLMSSGPMSGTTRTP
jgi:hypothetical protein